VVQKILRKARKGARVLYLPGNHDEFLRDYYGTHFGGIEVTEIAIHQGADGRRYLVTHGDMFDFVVTQARWLALIGDHAYELAILVNRLSLLVAVAMGEAESEERGELHRCLRANARRRGPAPWR
jgi:UDP-2,3-diacylglucosamine pyrophosphatase LpxH